MVNHKALLRELERDHNKLYSLLKDRLYHVLHESLIYGDVDQTHNLRVHKTVSQKVGSAILPIEVFIVYEGEIQIAAKWPDRTEPTWYIWKGGLVNVSQIDEALDLLKLIQKEQEVRPGYLERAEEYRAALISALVRMGGAPNV